VPTGSPLRVRFTEHARAGPGDTPRILVDAPPPHFLVALSSPDEGGLNVRVLDRNREQMLWATASARPEWEQARDLRAVFEIVTTNDRRLSATWRATDRDE